MPSTYFSKFQRATFWGNVLELNG